MTSSKRPRTTLLPQQLETHDNRVGTESFHNHRPSEVTLPAYTTLVTTLTFAEPGDYSFICHLPGHEAYGMTGTIRVVEA